MELGPENALARLQARGMRGLSSVDLLSLMLSREERDVDLNEKAALGLNRRFPGSRLADLSHADLLEAAGLEPFESNRLIAALELGRRVSGLGRWSQTEITQPEHAHALFAYLESEPQEHFCAAFLTAKAMVISTRTIHIGTLTMSVVGPRDVFREAIRENAASLIVAHNHPSGDPTPSPEDRAITRKLSEIGDLLDIPLLDHIIVGHGQFTSLKKLGAL